MVVSSVFHSSFTVSDLDASLAFYRDRLGLEVVMEQYSDHPYISQLVGFEDAKLRVAFVRVPGDRYLLELIEYVNPRGGGSPPPVNSVGGTHLCFYVADLEAAHRSLVEAGVQFVSEPVDIRAGVNSGARGVYLRDPDGITLELHQRAPAAG
jgi:catechol 2,3-dioxygenase-like lactoylglutathione lyase family enzyme